MDPRHLNRPIGAALALVKARPECPWAHRALNHLNHAKRLALAGYGRVTVLAAVALATWCLRRATA